VSALDPGHLAVCVDFRSPHAWLAVEPTRALEARLGAAFDWLPLAVSPLVRPEPERDGDDRGTRHRRFRARYFENDLRRYAEGRGLALGDPYRAPDTGLASLALLYVRAKAPQRGGAFAARGFELAWQLAADVAKPEAVDGALTLIGVDPRGFRDFAAGDGPRQLAALQTELEELGLFTVPAYLLGSEPFLGRQHLPMVEWLLTGRTGPPPI